MFLVLDEIESLREKYPDVAGELYTVDLVKGELGLGKKSQYISNINDHDSSISDTKWYMQREIASERQIQPSPSLFE